MSITTRQILQALYILSWIIFVGVCIEAGGFLTNTFYTMVINPVGAKHFWPGLDLGDLYAWDRGYFLLETLMMCVVAVLRSWIFYLIIKLLHDKRVDLYRPFNSAVGRFLFHISYLSLLTGLFSVWGAKYAQWFVQKGLKMPDIQYLRLGGADVWLFMGVTLYVLAQIFKRGIEIQTENELTV
jgi:hypothetical protein